MTPSIVSNNYEYLDQQNISRNKTYRANALSCGRNFVRFVADNTLNFLGGAIASGLLVKKWHLSGAVLMAYCAQSFVGDAVRLQTWIPRPVRQFVLKAGGITGIVVATAAACALIAAKSHILGISILIYATYHFVDSLGLVPRRISLGVERYFPWRALLALPTLQASIWGLLNVLTFVSYIPPFVRFSYETGDLIMHKILGMKNPSLKAVNAPFVPKPALTYDSICSILNGKESDFIINVTHCSRSATSTLPKMREDRHFEKLAEMSKQISWRDNYTEIFSHHSFINFLTEEFPSVSKDQLKKSPHIYAEKLAKAKGLTIESYADRWLHARLGSVVDLLKGKWGCRVGGTQSELADAIDDSAKIIPYLIDLKNSSIVEQPKLKKMLFTYALNSSSRQASEIKAVAARVLHEAAENRLKMEANDPTTFAKRYEFQVRSSLQNTRVNIIDNAVKGTESELQEVCDLILPPSQKEKDERARKALEKKTEENFLVMVHRYFLSFGFLPLSNYERNNCNLPVQYIALFCQYVLNFALDSQNDPTIYDTYRKRLDSTLATCHQGEFWTYIDQLLETHVPDRLQRAQLRYRFVNKQNDPATVQAFRRLLLVSLGVLKKKAR